MKPFSSNPNRRLSKTGGTVLAVLLGMALAVLALVAIVQTASRSQGGSQVSPARASAAGGFDQVTGGMAGSAGIPTSTDLADFLVSATLNAPQGDGGQYVVTPGTSYSFRLSFQERYGDDDVLQFPDSATMTYAIPEALDFANGNEGAFNEGTFTIKIRDGSDTYSITDNTYVLQGGVLRVNFNTAHADFDKLTATANVRFTLEFQGRLVGDAETILFSDGIEKHLTVDTTNSVTASKSARFDKENNRVEYAVTVHSLGRSTDVHVRDAMTGEALTLDASSIVATSSTGQPVTMTGGAQGNSFEYVIPSMADNEFVTLTYHADIDPLAIPSNNGCHMTVGDNAVEAWSTGDPVPDRHEVRTTIDYTPTIDKSDGTVTSESGNIKTMSWVIEANQNPVVTMAGTAITDTIGPSSQAIMTYSGDGLTVAVRDAAGNLVRTDLVPWSQLASKTDSSWTYVVPPADANAAYSYTIGYTTDVDLTGKVSATTVDNGVTTSGGKSSSGTGQALPAGGEVLVHKAATDVDLTNKEVTWNISFNVPADGLTSAEVLDIYPFAYDADGLTCWREPAKEGSVTVSGLVDGEAYAVAYGATGATITFYQDEGKTQTGLRAAGARTVSIELKTIINEEWLEASMDYNDNAGRGGLTTHRNTAQLSVNGGTPKVTSANTTITLPETTKTVQQVGTRTVNGIELPIYMYNVVVTGVTSDDIEIEDKFDTDLLTYYEGDYPDAGHVYGGNVNWQGNGNAKFNRLDTVDGMTISTNSSCLPHDPNGAFHPAYRFVYYLTVKDAAALNTIKERAAAADDGRYSIGNTATCMGGSSTVNVTYQYDGLRKEILTSDSELRKTDDDIWADFRITLNGGGMLLNGGEDLVMTDTVSNLSVDVNSITANPPSGVSWDMRGNTVTYVVPDGIPIVITYRARVIMASAGDEGDTQRIDFSNCAEMKSYREDISKTAEYTNSGGYGSGSIASINILKYRAGDMTQTLAGAVFQLQDSNGRPVRDKDGNPVEFTTGSDGKISIKGNMQRLGWVINEDVQYCIEEKLAPEGFMLMRNKYRFTVSSDGTTDYGRYLYYSGDTMTVKDYPGTDVRVEKVWLDGNESHASDEVAVRLQQSVAGGEWSDVIRHEDADGQWVDEGDMVVTLSAANGWEATFRELPLAVPTNLGNIQGGTDAAVDYRVIEVSVNGEPLAEGILGTGGKVAGSGTYVYTVTNGVRTGELEVAKTVRSDKTADRDTAFSFTVTIRNADGTTNTSIDGAYGDMTFNHGVATLSLKHGESKVATDLPQGVAYVVEEATTEGFSTQVGQVATNEASGTISAERSVVSFTNARERVETGELEVTKTVRSDDTADRDAEFEFTVTLTGADGATDTSISGTYDDMTFDAGVATFTLTHGASKVATGLPQGTGYTVTETPADGFTTTIGEDATDTASGTISDTRSVVAFTNTRNQVPTGGLTVEKTVVSHTVADKEAQYDFTVKLNDETINGQYGEMTFANGEAHFSLTDKGVRDEDGKSTGTKTADGLPVGIGYAVTEVTEGFTVTSTGETGETGVVPAPEGAADDVTPTYPTASFTNTRNEGSITLTKVVTGATSANADTEYAVAIVLKDADGLDATFVNDEHDGVTFDRGRALVTLKAGETKTITGLPQGLAYSVAEVTMDAEGALVSGPPAGFEASYAGQSGEISADGASVTITNAYDAHGETALTATKVLDGRPFVTGDEWEFSVVPSEGAPLPKDAQGRDVTQVTIDPTEGTETTVDFGTIAYAMSDLGGRRSAIFTYTIIETTGKDETGRDKVQDVLNDSAKVVTVMVSDNGNGTLDVRKTVDGTEVTAENPITFTNVYQARDTLQVAKHLEGRAWMTDAGPGESERYGFEIIATGDSLAKLGASPIESVAYTDGEAKPAVFGDLLFTTADAGSTYSYTIREIVPDDAVNPGGVAYGSVDSSDGLSGPWTKDGVRYSDRQFEVRYEVSTDGSGNIQVAKTCSPATDGGITFTNTYEAREVTQEVVATKSLTGRQLTAGDFEFLLHDVTRNKDYVARNGYVTTPNGSSVAGEDASAIVFDGIDAFDAAGEYEFLLSESVPAGAVAQADGTPVLDGMSYDTTAYEVTIIVTDDLRGHLVASEPTYRVASSDAAGGTVAPTFVNSYFGAQADIAFGKYFYGNDANAKFGFTLEAADGDGFEPRQHGAGDAITNDGSAYGEGNPLVDDGSAFRLSLTNADAFDEAGHATVSVPTITYHSPGTYRYVITEDATDSAMSGDESELLVAVTVHEDATVDPVAYAMRADGTVTPVAAQDAAFYNNSLVAMGFRSRALAVRLQAESVRTAFYTPKVRKVLTGGILKKDEFSFTLRGSDGTPISTVSNDASGTVAFGTLSYGSEDVGMTYVYTISENAGTDTAILYDTHVITLTVQVSEADDGSLVVTDAYYVSDSTGGLVRTDDPTIINAYDNIVIHAVKRTREFNEDGTINNDAEGLPGAHYGLWMVNPDGEDIYMGLGRNQIEEEGAEFVSDENGNLYYDIPPIQGVAYYLLEEAPAPKGHLVDPYPTDYFTLVRDEDGFRLVYENDGPDANGKVLTDYVPALGR